MSVKKIGSVVVSSVIVATALLNSASASASTVAITEWMYSGDEFIEFTNLTNAAIDFTGWSYDDDSRSAGAVSLDAFGLVHSGESVILAESDADSFRSAWNLSPAIKVIGGNSVNLGRNDEINLYNASNILVDRLTYGDQNFAGTIRTQNASGNPNNVLVLGQDVVTSDWVLSADNDVFGSFVSTGGNLGNPGQFALATVPVPAAFPLMLSALAAFSLTRKKRA